MRVKNNNKEVIARLAKNNYQSNRQRNYLLILSVTMIIVLLFSIFNIAKSQIDMKYTSFLRWSGHAYTITLDEPTDEQYKQIQKLDYIDFVGRLHSFGYVGDEYEIKLIANTVDKVAFEKLFKLAYIDIHGTYPEKENEIMLPIRALDNLGITNPEIDMLISLDINMGDNSEVIETETFILSGYYTEFVDEHDQPPLGYFSETYLESLGLSLTSSTTLLMKQTEGMLFEEAEEKLYADVPTTNDIQQFYASDTIDYAAVESIYGNYDVAIMLGVIIVVSVSLLLNNIMQISLEKDVRELGLLRTIGTTKKQIYRILQRQILRIACIGVVIGSIVALIINIGILPRILSSLKIDNYLGIQLSISDVMIFRPELLMIVIGFSFIVCFISMLLPLKHIYKLSPREALYYIEGKTKINKKQIHHHKGASITRMAWRSISKNRLRFIKTILSLFIASILTICSVMAIQILDYSNDFENNPDFSVQTEYWIGTEAVLTKEGAFLNEDVIKEIENIQGVKDIRVINQSYAIFDSTETAWQLMIKAAGDRLEEIPWGEYWGGIIVLSDDEIKAFEKFVNEENINVNMEGFKEGKTFLNLHHHIFSEKMNEETTDVIGEKVTFYNLYKENVGELEFGGYLDLNTRGLPKFRNIVTNTPNYPYILMSQTALENLNIDSVPTRIYVNIEEGQELLVEAELIKVLSARGDAYEEMGHPTDEEVMVMSKYDDVQKAKDYIYSIKIMLFSMSALLIGMGIFNYFNVLHTSLTNRKKELVTLEGIGMTRKQLRRMLITEGVLYSAVITGLLLTIGTGVLYIVNQFIRAEKLDKAFVYPTLSVVILISIMFIISIILPLLMYRRIQKQTIIERMSQ
ncbi:MAG: FtsX-like permease family protein [Coprobacillaceae bacterium]